MWLCYSLDVIKATDVFKSEIYGLMYGIVNRPQQRWLPRCKFVLPHSAASPVFAEGTSGPERRPSGRPRTRSVTRRERDDLCKSAVCPSLLLT